MSLMQNKKFRNDVLRVLVKLYMNLEKPDFINVCQVNIKYIKTLVAYYPDSSLRSSGLSSKCKICLICHSYFCYVFDASYILVIQQVLLYVWFYFDK